MAKTAFHRVAFLRILREGLACALAFAALSPAAPASAADAPSQSVEIAVSLPLSGEEASYGEGALLGIKLAIEEANARRAAPHIDLDVLDDKGSDDEAKAVAERIVAGKAALMLGPAFSTASLAAGPVYAQAGLAALSPTATSDAITDNATTFRVIFKNSEQGVMLANYLHRVLNVHKADVIVVDNKYGKTLQAGFERVAGTLGIDAHYFVFSDPDAVEAIARVIAGDASQPAVVILTLDSDAADILTALRRFGAKGPILGGDALGDEVLSTHFTDLPEERRDPGHFTEGVYGITPVILDSANADTLSFVNRFRARFGRDPVWQAVAGYDAAVLGVAAARSALAEAGADPDVRTLRASALAYLNTLQDPARALPGLLGPLTFDRTHGRQQAVRIGQFHRGHFESAPLQLVPVTAPDASELTSGAVFELEPGRFARLQRVVYTGVFVNEIPRVDLARSSFGADFYLWLRFARNAGPASPDPTDILFPNLLSGSLDLAHPAEQGLMPDGTEYRLWRIQGEFRNDYDLHRFPFDRQTLRLPFFNARAAADRVIYALDRRSSPGERQSVTLAAATPPAGSAFAATPQAAPDDATSTLASPQAFRNLTQWTPLGASERRENLVIDSALGDPRRVGAESFRELSGFLVTVELERRAIATLAKTLLPLLLMTLIMFASLYFPPALVKEKVTVAITAALSGAVLLTAINNQLGTIGYTVAVEYAFYIFFGLSLLCIVSVLGVERLRVAGRGSAAIAIEHSTRFVFVVSVAAILLAAFLLRQHGGLSP